MNVLMGKAITPGPIRTLRARGALGVVHTFFVRASDNSIGHDSGARCVGLEKAENLFANIKVLAYVIVALGVPALEKIRSVALLEEHAHHHLAGQFVIGSIEGDGSDWEPSKSRPEFPLDPGTGGRLLPAKMRLSPHRRNIRCRLPSCPKPAMALFSSLSREIFGCKNNFVRLLLRIDLPGKLRAHHKRG